MRYILVSRALPFRASLRTRSSDAPLNLARTYRPLHRLITSEQYWETSSKVLDLFSLSALSSSSCRGNLLVSPHLKQIWHSSSFFFLCSLFRQYSTHGKIGRPPVWWHLSPQCSLTTACFFETVLKLLLSPAALCLVISFISKQETKFLLMCALLRYHLMQNSIDRSWLVSVDNISLQFIY